MLRIDLILSQIVSQAKKAIAQFCCLNAAFDAEYPNLVSGLRDVIAYARVKGLVRRIAV